MLLTSRPARSHLTHLERAKLTPSHDPNLSICSRSHIDTPFYFPRSDAHSRAPLVSIPTTQPARQPPTELGRRSTVANVGAQGEKMNGLSRTHQNLSVPKRVRFHGVDIIIPPPPSSPPSPTAPTENISDETQNSSGGSDVPDQAGSSPSSIVSCETARPTSSEHDARVFLNQETSTLDEFPDSPSVYSPTPPNSSASPTSNFLERGSPASAEADWGVIDISHHCSTIGRFSNEDPFNQPPASKQPHSKNESAPTPRDEWRNGQVPKRQRDESVEALSWWGYVSIASVALSVTKAWRKTAHTTAAKESHDANKVGDRRRVESAGQG